MKVYVFYYSDGDGYPSADRIFKTKEAAEKYQRQHPDGAFGPTWYEELELNTNKECMIVLNDE